MFMWLSDTFILLLFDYVFKWLTDYMIKLLSG